MRGSVERPRPRVAAGGGSNHGVRRGTGPRRAAGAASGGEGEGQGAITLVSFKPVQARFVRLTQTAAADKAPPLSIQQLRLFEAGKASAK